MVGLMLITKIDLERQERNAKDLVMRLLDRYPRISFDILEEGTKLSIGTLQTIFQNNLKLVKNSKRCVPDLLSQKKRLNFAKQMLNKFDSSQCNIYHILTSDESLFYYSKIYKRQT